MRFTLLILLLNNLILSQFNFPTDLEVLISEDETLLIGTDSVVFSWTEPDDIYPVTLFINNIKDTGNGSVDFDVSLLLDGYFDQIRAFNIGILSGEANLQISSINGGYIESLNWSTNVVSNVIQANNVNMVLNKEWLDCGLDGECQYFEVVDIDTEEYCESTLIGGTWIDGDCVSSIGTCDNTGHLNTNWPGEDDGECNDVCEDTEADFGYLDENGDGDCGFYVEFEEMDFLQNTCSEEFISQGEWNFNDLNGNQVCDQDLITNESTELDCNEIGGNWSDNICTIDECESYTTCHLFTMKVMYDAEYDQTFYVEHDFDATTIFHNSTNDPIADYQWLPTLWQPGNNIESPPQNLECSNCNVGFNNCPYQCATPYTYKIYRYEFENCLDSDENNVCDNLNEESLDFDQDQSILLLLDTVEYQDQPYDTYNETYTYFSDTTAIPQQGYCYYVTASHPSIPDGETSQEDALDKKLCIVTECVTSLYYPDEDADGLGDINQNAIEACLAPDGYVSINEGLGIDEYPDCPNIQGENPYDCNNDCFEWNEDEDIRIYFEGNNYDCANEDGDDLGCPVNDSGTKEWLELSDDSITREIYDDLKKDFCSFYLEEPFYDYRQKKGCAKLDDDNNDDPDWECPICYGYCYEGLTGNEVNSFYQDDAGNDIPGKCGPPEYFSNGDAPEYFNKGALNCSGECNPIDLSTGDVDLDQVDTLIDDCGWCCSCDPNNEDGEECIPPYTVIGDEVVFNDNDIWNECSYYNNGEYAGHYDCASDIDQDGSPDTCWYVPSEDSDYGPAFVNECGFCDEEPNCGETSEVQDFNVEVQSDSISIRLEWTEPTYHNLMYSYVPEIAVNISSISLLDITDDGYEVAEIELKIDNKMPLNSFSIQISSELLKFYDNQGYGGRADSIGMSIYVTESEDDNNGQIFAFSNNEPLGIGNEVVSKFRVKIRNEDCFSSENNDCDYYFGERFNDTNNSLTFDPAETFEDLNGNLKWDKAEDFDDLNNNDEYDSNDTLYDCDPNTGLCSDCKDDLYDDGCYDQSTYHPFGSDGDPGTDDDCPCNEVGICILYQNLSSEYNTGYSIYNNYDDCIKLWNECRDNEIEECQDLTEETHVWLEWSDDMGNGIWDDEEPYDDSNANNEYDSGEHFFDYGSDGCVDEYETGPPLFGCNSEPDYLTMFNNSDPNQDNNYGNNNGEENNFEYNRLIIDKIIHFENQSAFTDNVQNIYNECNDQIEEDQYGCYLFLDTKWNVEELEIEQVGLKNDSYCYDSGIDGAIENESYYNGQPEDCAPDILYRINEISGNFDQEVAILYDTTSYTYDENILEPNTEYCFNVDTQVIYNYGSIDNGCNDFNCFDSFVYSDNVNFILESEQEECVTTGCNFVTLYTDSDGDGFGDPNESILWCPGDPSAGLVSNYNDEWPSCYNAIIDEDPYDCTYDDNDESTWDAACNGPNEEDLNGNCCNESFIDICGICGGNGNSCEGLLAPVLEATSSDTEITLSWNAVNSQSTIREKNKLPIENIVNVNSISNRVNRELVNVEQNKLTIKDIDNVNNSRNELTFSVLEIDDLGFVEDCGPPPDGNGEECIGSMIFKIEIENYSCDNNCIYNFNISFNTNDDYYLNDIADRFFDISVDNQGLIFTDNSGNPMNMNYTINSNNIYVESTGSEITESGILMYVQGYYDLELMNDIIEDINNEPDCDDIQGNWFNNICTINGENITITFNDDLSVFQDIDGQEINSHWNPTIWQVGIDLLDIGNCGNGECEPGENFVTCPQDCDENISYVIRRDNIPLASNITDTTYIDDDQLVQNTTYCYTVVATNGLTNSPPSNLNCISLDCAETIIFYSDNDGDGLGDPNDFIESCVAPNGYVPNSSDEYPDCANDLSVDPYDCLGECNGNAVVDECGICNGGGIEEGFCDCDGNIEDCLGICGGNTLQDCLGVCEGDATIDECGICNGDGIEEGFCDCDGNVEDCLGVCGGDALVDECGICNGDGLECGSQAPLYLTATSGLYREIQLNWQEPVIDFRNIQPLQIVINNIVDDGNGNAELWINMSNPMPVSFFNFQILQNDNFSIIDIDEEVGSIAAADIEIFTSQNYISIENTESSNDIPIGNQLFMIVNTTYDLNSIGEIITLDFSNMSFLDNLGEQITVSSIPTEWVIGSEIENIPLYCGDNICDENESINQSCEQDCSFSYIVVIDGTWVEQNWIDLSYLHSGLGMGEENCYEIKAKLNNDILYESPSVCATTQVLDEPRILSIEDQANDDGGYVILSIEPQKNDTISEGYFYEIFRQYNNGPWTSVDLFGAYGLDLYTVVTTTVADLTTNDNGDTLYNEHFFRVRYLDTVSDSVSGYSVNNLAPDPVTGLELSVFGDILIELDWDSNTELDLGYYSVYSRSLNSDWIVIENTDDSNLLINIPDIVTEYAVTASDTTGNESELSSIVTTETLDLSLLDKPASFTLYPTYPNPFNPIANIRYGLSEPGWINLKIYDVVGREISQLVNKYQSSGNFDVQWDASNYNSGLYFIKCSTQSEVLIQKILLVK